jgi:hypothetical protein
LHIDEPFAAAVVYSAALAAWLWLATWGGLGCCTEIDWTKIAAYVGVPIIGFFAPFGLMVAYDVRLGRHAKLHELARQLLLAEEGNLEEALKQLRTHGTGKDQTLLPPGSAKQESHSIERIEPKGIGLGHSVACRVWILSEGHTLSVPIEREARFALDSSREVWQLNVAGEPTNSR